MQYKSLHEKSTPEFSGMNSFRNVTIIFLRKVCRIPGTTIIFFVRVLRKYHKLKDQKRIDAKGRS